MQKMGYSNICTDLTTFWNRNQGNCEPCDKKAGSEVENNCGRGDDGGIHTDTHKKCKPNTFNDGSQYYCRECSTCPPGTTVVKNCTSVSDIICQEIRNESTTTPLPKSITTHAATSLSTAATTQTYITTVSPSSQQAALWTVPIIIIIIIILLVAALCALMMKKRGVCKKAFYRRRTSYQNEGFSPIQPERNSEVLCDMLNADILSAPLHKVLDDLDVLEELVILLDPDTQGIKSTKHLASHCSFPSTWITYTYSMKDTKSPLKAVLEGVTSKQPDWTVGHLAKLLRQMNRNDAISVLAKLRPIPKNFI
ncbi:IGF-like family receptor 1 isoform X2 [Poecilia reticulata]|uniref:IGF-like family receptor 1 isoform X2 n=1 Tax=Poecilia reticulata TaxID=8081 RepID=UPI0004A2B9A1|nr:PREDICTED: IGF-like family receptor 1 isoform X2 [Poecilia reticulata]